MSVVKSVVAASVILGTLGLAGCQTTEERVYYSSDVSYRPSTVYYDDTPRWRPAPPPRVVVAPPPVYYGDVRPIPPRPPRPPHLYGGGMPEPRHTPRYERTYRYHDPSISGTSTMRRTSGQAPGYDTQ